MRLKLLGSKVASPRLTRVRYPDKEVDPHYRSPEHEEWARAVKQRDGFRCQDAGPHGGRLVADHITEIRDGGALHDPANGRTLCTACHNRKTAAERAVRLTSVT